MGTTSSPAACVEVTNPSDGGFVLWLFRFYAFGALCALGLLALVGAGLYIGFSATIPAITDLATYQQKVATTTQVRAWDGTPLAELATQHREIIAFSKIPPLLVQAFLSAEDRRFYEHGAIDVRGIARALGANIRAGEVAQGGSTITQQVAKSFLSSERTIERKIREAIMARRLEAHFTKNDILALYLNQVFLGAGAYGVASGARRYFDKSVDELDLGEMATLAGLVRAPSRFSPLVSHERGRARRDQVLQAMADNGIISAEEATGWKSQPLVLHPPPDLFRQQTPYFTEQVRRELVKRYDEKRLWEGGLTIETTLLPWIDAAGASANDFTLRKLDKRQGWRGPVARVEGAAAREFKQRSATLYGREAIADDRPYLGLVEEAQAGGSYSVRIGAALYTLPPAGLAWAIPYSTRDSSNGKLLTSTEGVLRAGDVVWVRAAHPHKRKRYSDWTFDEKSEVQWLPGYDEDSPKPRPRLAGEALLALDQTPRVQGALFTYDHDTGYVLAMQGGLDYDRSQFNRVTQACRQPGSSYKPIYYSLALDKGYGFSSLLNDVPRAEVDPVTGEVWTPTNLNNTVEYQVTLEYALIWSKNVPSVQIFKLVGGHEVEAWARRLGITTPIIPDQALALGASCSRIDEMTRAFSAFARNGVLSEPIIVRRVRDATGVLLEDNSSLGDPMGRADERLDRLVAHTGKKAAPVISPRTAYLTSTLLRHVVTRGHAPAIRLAGQLAAGKTGTSSATMDMWFIGFTSRWMTTTWIGDDRRERPLGAKDAAFMFSVPMFARFINETTAGQPLKEVPWERPPGVKPGDTGGKLRTTMDEVKANP